MIIHLGTRSKFVVGGVVHSDKMYRIIAPNLKFLS